jgi:beta-galactosidase
MAKKICAAAFVALLMIVVCFAETYTGEPNNRIKINLGATPWKFIMSDPPGAQNATGVNEGPWATVGIPHTWSDTLSFLNNAASTSGPGYNATTWYRKHFTLDNSYSGKKIFIEFRGAGVGAAVYINNTFIKGNSAYNPNATHVFAFIPFIVDITPYAKFGADTNVLAVRVGSSGGFYNDPGFAGGYKFGMGCNGLFRPVYMHICDKVYVPANVYSVVNNWGT